MPTQSDVEIIFQDLADTFKELREQRSSPKIVRRAFARFLTLSQQLTEIMRKEYKRITEQNWNAEKFSGWNNVTALFKKLRREDYHEYPVLVYVRERQYFPISAIYKDSKSNDLLVYENTWPLGSPFSEEPLEGIQLAIVDNKTGKTTDEIIDPIRREYDFILFPRTDDMRKAIEEAGSDDVRALSEQCFSSLTKYVEYYRANLMEGSDEF